MTRRFWHAFFGTDEQGKAQNTGFLYEYAWKDAYAFDYLGSDLQIYAELFEPKTRETEAPSLLYGPLESFFKDFNEVPDADFERVVGKQLDLVKFVRFIAVENFLADRDSFLGYWGPNNFYFYRFASARPAELITWDKDLAFWAYDYDIYQGTRDNVLASRVLSIPGFHRLYLETLLACAAAAAAPVWSRRSRRRAGSRRRCRRKARRSGSPRLPTARSPIPTNGSTTKLRRCSRSRRPERPTSPARRKKRCPRDGSSGNLPV